MNANELKHAVSHLSIWRKNGQRAPHKPLLILLALAELQRRQTVLPYELVRDKLKRLLVEFGPPRKSFHPEEPFVRLAGDGIWGLSEAVDRRSFSDGMLRANRISGGFTPEVQALFKADGQLIQEIAEQVLEEHFPETMHAELLEAVGLDFSARRRRRRDPEFREKILRAYEHSCAVCGFNVRLGSMLVAVEAAHIQWHQAGGPDTEENGIALCSLHHKLFDRGVFTITERRELLVAEEAHGTNGFAEWLMRFHGQTVRQPIHPGYAPNDSFVGWHAREVFRGPARYRTS